MTSASHLRSRRNAAELDALAGVQREIRANDNSANRKYLREFSEAFQSYQQVISEEEIRNAVAEADVVLVGDYHALPASQRYAAELIEQCAEQSRPIVLGIEAVFARDQHIMDAWWRREIGEQELRERIRFDLDWNYDWAPFYELLTAAREHADVIYGLDCTPREDLRRIAIRDRHAAHKLGEIRLEHPRALIIVLFGESHLAPGHLPLAIAQESPTAKVLTVLQNVDSLYWQAAGEQEHVRAVRVDETVICVFNSTPLEKYEHYRLCFKRWNCEGRETADPAPTIYNLIDTLARFLNIDRYCPHNHTQPKFLVDRMPEIYCGSSDTRLRQLLMRCTGQMSKVDHLASKVDLNGSMYLPSINAFYMRDFQIASSAEEATRFLHHACRGLPFLGDGEGNRSSQLSITDRFYARAVEHALAYFGSRVLYPAREAVRAEDGSDVSREIVEKMAASAAHAGRAKFDFTAQQLGYMLGTGLYDTYLRGALSRRTLRNLFLATIEAPGQARDVCLSMLRKIRRTRRKPCLSVPQ